MDALGLRERIATSGLCALVETIDNRRRLARRRPLTIARAGCPRTELETRVS